MTSHVLDLIPGRKSKTPATTAGVLAQFRKTIDALKAVEEQHSTLADRKLSEARAAEAEAIAAQQEARAAAEAQGKLAAVFG